MIAAGPHHPQLRDYMLKHPKTRKLADAYDVLEHTKVEHLTKIKRDPGLENRVAPVAPGHETMSVEHESRFRKEEVAKEEEKAVRIAEYENEMKRLCEKGDKVKEQYRNDKQDWIDWANDLWKRFQEGDSAVVGKVEGWEAIATDDGLDTLLEDVEKRRVEEVERAEEGGRKEWFEPELVDDCNLFSVAWKKK